MRWGRKGRRALGLGCAKKELEKLRVCASYEELMLSLSAETMWQSWKCSGVCTKGDLDWSWKRRNFSSYPLRMRQFTMDSHFSWQYWVVKLTPPVGTPVPATSSYSFALQFGHSLPFACRLFTFRIWQSQPTSLLSATSWQHFFLFPFFAFSTNTQHTARSPRSAAARSVFKNPEIYVRNLPVSPPGTCATSCGSAHTCGLPRQLAVDQAAATPGLRRSRERCLETKSYLWNAEGGTGSAEPLTTGLLFGEWSFLWFVGKTSSQYEAAKGQPSPTLVRSSSCSHSASCSSMPRCTRVRSKWLWFLLPYAYAPYLEAATQGDID